MYQVPTCIFGECSQGSFARAFQWSNILWTGLRDFHEISNHILFYEINTPRFLKMSSTLGGVYKKVKSFTCYILDNWLTFTNILFINWTCTGLAMWYPKRAERKALSTSSKVPHLSSVWFLFRLITVYLHVSFGHWRTILFLMDLRNYNWHLYDGSRKNWILGWSIAKWLPGKLGLLGSPIVTIAISYQLSASASSSSSSNNLLMTS